MGPSPLPSTETESSHPWHRWKISGLEWARGWPSVSVAKKTEMLGVWPSLGSTSSSLCLLVSRGTAPSAAGLSQLLALGYWSWAPRNLLQE